MGVGVEERRATGTDVGTHIDESSLRHHFPTQPCFLPVDSQRAKRSGRQYPQGFLKAGCEVGELHHQHTPCQANHVLILAHHQVTVCWSITILCNATFQGIPFETRS